MIGGTSREFIESLKAILVQQNTALPKNAITSIGNVSILSESKKMVSGGITD